MALLLAGGDADAKATVAGLIEAFGFGAVDTGPLGAGARRQQVGLNNVLLTQRVSGDFADVVPNDAFRSAFIRLRTQRGLYREDPSAVTFLTPTLFRTGIPLPAEVPIGTYEVEIRLFANGAFIGKTETAFEIVKVGFEQFVATSARQNGLIYGLVTAAMALMTGWMASIVFRKD